MLSSCLIDDPPSYTAPTRTPPRLVAPEAVPPFEQVLVIKTGPAIPFTVPFASEDAGEPIAAYLLLDYHGDPSERAPLAVQDIPPGTLDTTRLISLTPKIPSTLHGCHWLTLRVTHRTNVRTESPELYDKTDSAEAYWITYVNPEPDVDVSLLDCPQPTQSTPQ